MDATTRTRKSSKFVAACLIAVSMVVGASTLTPRSAWADGRAKALIWEPTPPEAHREAIPAYLDTLTHAVAQVLRGVLEDTRYLEEGSAKRSPARTGRASRPRVSCND